MSSKQGPDPSKDVLISKNKLSKNEIFAWSWLLMEEYAGVQRGTFKFKAVPKELNSIVGPVAALHYLGSSKELDEKRNQIQELLLFSETLPATEENHTKITEGLDRLLDNLTWLHSQLKEAEKILENDGWQFDPKTKKVKALPLSNRPEELLNRAIRFLYEEEYEQFRESKEKSPQEIRQLIKDRLSLFFPTDMLGPESRGPIDRAIQNRPR